MPAWLRNVRVRYWWFDWVIFIGIIIASYPIFSANGWLDQLFGIWWVVVMTAVCFGVCLSPFLQWLSSALFRRRVD